LTIVNEFTPRNGVFDLNFSGLYRHAVPASGEGVAHASWPDGVCAVAGFHSRARVSALRRALSGQLQGHQFFLLGPQPNESVQLMTGQLWRLGYCKKGGPERDRRSGAESKWLEGDLARDLNHTR